MAKQKYMTKEDHARMVAELEKLTSVGRDEIAEKIKVARSFGDLSENAEYDEAMNEQAKLEATIAKLESDLRDVMIIDESQLGDNKTVRAGSKVRLLDMEENEEVEYKILGQGDIENNIISDQSPVGAALIDRAVGDVVDVNLPTGAVVQYRILAIS